VDLPLVAIEDPAYDRAQADMQRVLAERPPELLATGDVLAGRPGHTLVDACAEGVDLLVTGSRSYGPLAGALVGSVSRHLVDHAPCPVVIVPRGVMPELSPSGERHSSATGTGR
jgi:nucleotide-binding universal stress UspA family protein